MKAIIRRGQRMVCDEIVEPVPGPGQVLLRVRACGICGSDLHAFQHAPQLADLGRRVGAANVLEADRDLVFGHEICGEVLEYGPGIDQAPAVGSRVVALPRVTGPGGMETVGLSQRFVGGYAEKVLVDAANLIVVPDGLSDVLAAMTEPFAVGLHAVNKAEIGPDVTAVVIGCGPVGLAVIAALGVKGVGRTIASDPSPERRKAALAMGADEAVDPGQASPYAAPAGATVIFECVGAPGLIQQVVAGAPAGAHIVVVGVCVTDDSFLPYQALSKELRISFSAAYTLAEFEETLGHIASGRIDASRVVTSVIGRDAVPGAFTELTGRHAQVKVVIEPWRA